MLDGLTLALGLSFAGGFLGSALARACAWRYGIVSQPNAIVPQHTVPVAYLGGLGVLLGLGASWFATLLTDAFDPPNSSIVIPAVLFFGLGMFDDLRPLTPLRKLLAQLAIAVVAVHLGILLPLTGFAMIDNAMTMLWIIACVNAFNITDVCDGLVAGIAASIFLATMLLAPDRQATAAIGLGACLGLLPYNVPRASMFLGDAGSHLIGFLIAALALSVSSGVDSPAVHVMQMILLVLVPLFELTFVTIVRFGKGLPWWEGSSDHFALRLQQARWSRWRVDAVSWGISGAASITALLLPSGSSMGQFVIATVVLLSAAGVVRYLLRHEVRRP